MTSSSLSPHAWRPVLQFLDVDLWTGTKKQGSVTMVSISVSQRLRCQVGRRLIPWAVRDLAERQRLLSLSVRLELHCKLVGRLIEKNHPSGISSRWECLYRSAILVDEREVLDLEENYHCIRSQTW